MVKLGSLFRSKRKYGTGLILSGGGAKGFAHAGMLKALNEADIYPEIISCVSAGAIVGAFYADGFKPDEIFEIFSEGSSFFDYVKITVPKTGFFRTVGLKENLSKHLKSVNFNDLNLQLYVAAVNLNTGKVVYFNKGSILDKIQASAAIPILFEPVKIDGHVYIDGGMLDNFPLEPIKGQCRRLIGISLNPIAEEEDFSNLVQIAERTFRLSASSDIVRKMSHCDIVIEPEELAEFGMLDVSKGKEMFDLGYRVARKKLG
jgi:NTE family protein